jgi:beta-catenin-like protein 1
MELKQSISKNRLLRSKYPDMPKKFMESEIQLFETIEALPSSLEKLPPSYPDLLIGLLTHENEDIATSIVKYLLTSPELPDSLTSSILVQTLLRPCEELRILALSLLDRLPTSSLTITASTVSILIDLSCASETSPEIKAASSDYLFTLLTSSSSSISVDLDPILKSLSTYRKKDPTSEDIKEFISNIFSCLCTLLNHPDNRTSFRRLEGMELMIRLLKARNFTSSLALRVLRFALPENEEESESSQRFISVGGLKTVFSLFMGHHIRKQVKRYDADETEMMENVLCIVVSLCSTLIRDDDDMPLRRLKKKFQERDCEKVLRSCSLFVELDRKMRQDKEEEEEEEELDAELYSLWRCSLLILWIGKWDLLDRELRSKGLSLATVCDVAEECLSCESDNSKLRGPWIEYLKSSRRWIDVKKGGEMLPPPPRQVSE